MNGIEERTGVTRVLPPMERENDKWVERFFCSTSKGVVEVGIEGLYVQELVADPWDPQKPCVEQIHFLCPGCGFGHNVTDQIPNEVLLEILEAHRQEVEAALQERREGADQYAQYMQHNVGHVNPQTLVFSKWMQQQR